MITGAATFAQTANTQIIGKWFLSSGPSYVVIDIDWDGDMDVEIKNMEGETEYEGALEELRRDDYNIQSLQGRVRTENRIQKKTTWNCRANQRLSCQVLRLQLSDLSLSRLLIFFN